MGRRKLGAEVIKLAMEHLTGGLKSAGEVAKELCVNKATIFEWRSFYEKYGIEHFYEKGTNSTYTKEFKAMVVKEFGRRYFSAGN